MVLTISNCTLIDGTGADPVKNQDLRIENDTISWIGNTDMNPFDANDNDEIISLANSVVMPGLIDSHVHISQGYEVDQSGFLSDTIPYLTIRAALSCQKILDSGFTTVRNMGTYGYIDVAVKRAQEEGSITGPRMVASGEMLMSSGSGELGYVRPDVDIPDMKSGFFTGYEEAARAVRTQIYHGADVLKLIASGRVGSDAHTLPWDSEVTRDEIRAVTNEAHRLNRKVAAHAYSSSSVKDCVMEKVDSIEHGVMIDTETIKLMASEGTFLVPTMNAFNSYLMPDAASRYPKYRLDRGRPMAATQRKKFPEYLRHDISIAVGSDGPRPGSPPGSSAREIALLVDAGMDNLQAIHSATLNGAKLLGLDKEIGSIELNKKADIILVDGNPAEDISTLTNPDNIRLVILDGKITKNTC